MITTNNNITADQGSTIYIDWTCYADETHPFVLTDYVITFTAKKSYQGDVVISASTTDGKITITDGANGAVTLALLPEDTANIESSSNTATIPLVYDLEITSPLGRVYKASRGTLTLVKEVTK